MAVAWLNLRTVARVSCINSVCSMCLHRSRLAERLSTSTMSRTLSQTAATLAEPWHLWRHCSCHRIQQQPCGHPVATPLVTLPKSFHLNLVLRFTVDIINRSNQFPLHYMKIHNMNSMLETLFYGSQMCFIVVVEK